MKRIASIIILVMLLCGIVTSLAGCFVVPSGNNNQNDLDRTQVYRKDSENARDQLQIIYSKSYTLTL